MRLIDADAIRYIDLNADMPQSKVRVWVSFKEWIDAMPTIEERKKARWKGEGLTDYRCSLCGFLNTSRHRTNYCGNCGADMRGGEVDGL